MTEIATPMMEQYRRMRRELPADTILFFRLGDFYEMFFDDAVAVSRLLDLTLTKRQTAPMCGIPYHAADGYLARLIKAGKKVAICEQMEDPAAAKGIVRREITRVITPGAVLEEQVLDASRNNYLAGICRHGDCYGLALLDVSTGTFWIEEAVRAEAAAQSLLRYAPSECIVPDGAVALDDWRRELGLPSGILLSAYEEWTFEYDSAHDLLTRHFGVRSLDGFGCENRRAGIAAAGAVLHYVSRHLRRTVDHVKTLRTRQADDYLWLDESTVQHLDLFALPGERKEAAATLLGVLDTTRTAMGSRLLNEWLCRPLRRLDEIVRRHDAVAHFVKNRARLEDVRAQLGEIRDLERLTARLSAGGGNGRDLLGVAQSLESLPALKERLAGTDDILLAGIESAIQTLPEVLALIRTAIADEPPITIKEGGIIRKGYHADLDELRDAAAQGRQWLADFQTREQERTGIRTLKVRHNGIFGYYIEITNSQLANAPADYIRKQTLANAERFITPELKEYENKIVGAQDRAMNLEYQLFLEVRDAVMKETAALQSTAAALAQLDVLATFAERALALNYVRPELNETTELFIRDGRHPIVERMPGAEAFVPNDTQLDTNRRQLTIITGPNMAGKSTYIRQVALIVVLAQMGSFVPAAEARIGLVDRVFTRVGAGDDLARGRSTFMVEMQETANILHNATPRSLIVLDEIGRGTSTFDGISIAWAVAEYLHNTPAAKARTLFATHYHELTDLALTLPGVQNYNVLVRENNDQIRFLRKIVPGAADKSYGIQVARLAGLPAEVIGRAKEILANLEEGEFGEGGQPKIARHSPRRKKDSHPDQLALFGH